MKRRLFFIATLALALTSCGGTENAQTDTSATDEASTAAAEVNPLADFKFHTMVANLPSPLQTFNTMRTVKLDMGNVTLTPIEASSKLTTTSAKAYGYGLYITDMGFMAYQNQNQQTLSYLQTCRGLAEALGAGAIFDQTISANFEENSADEEKFVKMMDEAFTAMDQYMVDNERFVNATEIFVGSWLESQIIACRMLDGKAYGEDTKAVYNGIFEQKKHASNLMNVLSEIEFEMDSAVLNSVEDLMMFYAGFSNPEEITQANLKELESKLMTLKSHLLK